MAARGSAIGSASSGTSSNRAAHDCPYRLFVYPLSSGWRKNGGNDGTPGSARRLWSSSTGNPFIEPSFEGAAVGLQHFPQGVKIWNSGQFSTAQIVYQRALAHRCRTRNALEASLFLVPSWSIQARPLPSAECAISHSHRGQYPMPVASSTLYEQLRQVSVTRCTGGAKKCSALEARGGADHILLSPLNGGPHETRPLCELDYADVRLGAATRLAIEEPSHGRWRWFDQYSTLEMYSSMPHVSNLHLDSKAEAAPWRVRHRRSILASAAFGVGHGNRQNIGAQHALDRSSACPTNPNPNPNPNPHPPR